MPQKNHDKRTEDFRIDFAKTSRNLFTISETGHPWGCIHDWSLAKILSLSGSLLQILVDALSYKVKATLSTPSEPAERKACHESALKQSVERTVKLNNISATNAKKLHNKGKNKKIALLRYCVKETSSLKRVCKFTHFRGRTLHKLWYAWPSTTHEAPTFVSFFFFFFLLFFFRWFLSTIMSIHFDYVGWFASLNTDIWEWGGQLYLALCLANGRVGTSKRVGNRCSLRSHPFTPLWQVN